MKFNKTLTNDVVSFEQLGPGVYYRSPFEDCISEPLFSFSFAVRSSDKESCQNQKNLFQALSLTQILR